MRSEYVYVAAEALRQANAAQETGILSNPEDAAHVVILAFLNAMDTENLTPGAISWHEELLRRAQGGQ